jgi:uncharacterized protein YjbI with pentapeptide repeats
VANEEHVALLRQGVETWNTWRRTYSGKFPPDLAGADLHGMDLDGTDLHEVYLIDTDLHKGILSGANLRYADLSGANLHGADLNGADLHEASLFGANLSEADLSAASLHGTVLGHATLSHANLRGASLVQASLKAADLRGADIRRANLHGADLSEAKLQAADLRGADLHDADLHGADLSEAKLHRVNLSKANLSGADLREASLRGANLSGANLSGANMFRADLFKADLVEGDLCGANLIGANLTGANLVEADFANANLTSCYIYGVSAWKLKLDGAQQKDLVITALGEATITVDNIEVAQFVYLLLHNQKIRDVIETITSKAVLILGRFTVERKAVLDTLREELRNRGYLPILFDFEGSVNRSTDETITLLARMARFVIADVSDAKSVLQELRGIVPNLPSVPVQPIIVSTQDEPGMFDYYRPYPWFLKTYRYATTHQLITDLSERVIRPAEIKVQELRGQIP